MPYATQDDITRLYSPDALYVADRDGDGEAETDAVDTALAMASSEIDSYLGVRYPVPIAPVPALLVQFCVDMALYRLASSRDMLSEEHRRRYEDALAHLKRVGDGKAALIIPADPATTDGDGSDDGSEIDPEPTTQSLPGTPKPIVAGGPERDFTREKMKGL